MSLQAPGAPGPTSIDFTRSYSAQDGLAATGPPRAIRGGTARRENGSAAGPITGSDRAYSRAEADGARGGRLSEEPGAIIPR
jgi:hypothetical protein